MDATLAGASNSISNEADIMKVVPSIRNRLAKQAESISKLNTEVTNNSIRLEEKLDRRNERLDRRNWILINQYKFPTVTLDIRNQIAEYSPSLQYNNSNLITNTQSVGQVINGTRSFHAASVATAAPVANPQPEVVTAPVVTTPVVTTPVVTTPVITTPVITTPVITKSTIGSSTLLSMNYTRDRRILQVTTLYSSWYFSNPSIQMVEEAFGPSWRRSRNTEKFFHYRRKQIIDFINRFASTWYTTLTENQRTRIPEGYRTIEYHFCKDLERFRSKNCYSLAKLGDEIAAAKGEDNKRRKQQTLVSNEDQTLNDDESITKLYLKIITYLKDNPVDSGSD